MNIFIFHGTGGHSGENWFPWMKSMVERVGHVCIVLDFPTPDGQSLATWLEVWKLYQQHIGPETILIGHSLGGLFLLRVLEQLRQPVRAAFFVAAPIGVEPIKNYEADKAFAGGFDFEWKKIKVKAEHFSIFHSDNDPYVSLGNGELLAKKLGVDLNFIPNAGHFNAAAGYSEFPQLWDEVKIFLQEELQ